MQFLRNDRKGPVPTQEGFTLMEMLVVLAIIGVLTSVVVASLSAARVKSRDARRVADLKQLEVALELYYRDHRSYPVTDPDKTFIEGRCTSTGISTWTKKNNYYGSNAYIPDLAPQYISVLPGDPNVNGTTHRCYGYSSDGQKYFLWAHLGIEGSYDSNDPMVRLQTSDASHSATCSSTIQRTYFVSRNLTWLGSVPRCFNFAE